VEHLTERITADPTLCNAKPTVHCKHITVHTILEYLSNGENPQEILREYPSLESEVITACSAYAAHKFPIVSLLQSEQSY
jgi:uncharacterized protein (DUF433 family)